MDQKELIEKITKEVMKKLQESGKGSSETGNQDSKGISQAELASYIDHTLLKPEAHQTQFDQLVEEAKKHSFFSVCVNSSWVSYVAKKLRGHKVKVCSVIGFPLGGMDIRSKSFEARTAISNGADELDMVINVGALKSKDYKIVEEDIRSIKRVCRNQTILKVIIETSLLTEEEKVIACELSRKAGADFVKTSTGFGGGGASVEDIKLMRRVVGKNIGVKASGGIRNFQQAVDLLDAGANRLGCGSSIAVITGGTVKGNY